MPISRHSIDDLGFVEESFERTLRKLSPFSDDARITGEHFDLLLSNAWFAGAYGSALNGKSAEVGHSIRLAADASACVFAATSRAQSKPLLDGQPLANLKRSDESTMYASRWIQAFFLNSLCRSTDNLDILCGVPLDVLRGSSTQGPDFRDAFTDAIQRFWTGREGVVDLLIEAMEKTDPDKYRLLKPEWVLHFDVPQIHLFSLVVSEDPEAAAGLAKALELHKGYWSKTEDRRMDPDGFLAINLLGLAAMAYDRNIPFDVDSEYLPMSLVDGSFLKQQPTN